MRRARLVAVLLVSVVVALPSVIAGAPAPIGTDVIQLRVRVGETFSVPGRHGDDYVYISAPETIESTGGRSEGGAVFITFRCLKVGESAIVIDYEGGTKGSYLIECIPGFAEFAPSAGGAADEPRRFSTGNNTKVTKVDCKNPVSCDIANNGREGGFLARCVGRGSGEGEYIYEPILDKPPAKKPPVVSGKLRARCPRD